MSPAARDPAQRLGAGAMGMVGAQLSARLTPGAPEPVTIALSGGGDSLALLLMAHEWSAAFGRRLVAVTVDHGLHPHSAGWARACAARCAALDIDHRTVRWTRPKPSTGLAAAARQARHRLLAEAARQIGAQVILLGHTADDVQEAAWMRESGARTPSPRAWSPSPVWPEGRGIFLLRPLLGVRRGDLRDWLAARSEAWIDDPANDDPRHLRARARTALASGLAVRSAPGCTGTSPEAAVGRAIPSCVGPAGEIRVATPDLLGAGPAALAWLSGAVVCAGGGERIPPRRALQRVLDLARQGERFSATVGRTRLLGDRESLLLVRTARDRRSAMPPPIGLSPGQNLVWDGRFEVCATAPGLRLAAMQGLAGRLARADRRALRDVPAAARPSLPVLISASGEVACPRLTPAPEVWLRPLAPARLAAHLGDVQNESRLAAWRNQTARPK